MRGTPAGRSFDGSTDRCDPKIPSRLCRECDFGAGTVRTVEEGQRFDRPVVDVIGRGFRRRRRPVRTVVALHQSLIADCVGLGCVGSESVGSEMRRIGICGVGS